MPNITLFSNSLQPLSKTPHIISSFSSACAVCLPPFELHFEPRFSNAKRLPSFVQSPFLIFKKAGVFKSKISPFLLQFYTPNLLTPVLQDFQLYQQLRLYKKPYGRVSQRGLRVRQPGLTPRQPCLRPSQPGLRPGQPGLRASHQEHRKNSPYYGT